VSPALRDALTTDRFGLTSGPKVSS
jgi:hypothetical protein